VLTKEGVRYLLFYDYDGKEWLAGVPDKWYAIFPSRNGFHIVADGLFTARQKRNWWTNWQRILPSDYRLSNLNWLAPHSQAEFDFIMDLIGSHKFLKCSYYRDKQIWETFRAMH
jgi:hypothetical protein